jgi:type I restriction enzyme R subunit
MTPRRDETSTSKLPALKVLLSLGWQYLTPDETLAARGGRTSEVLLVNLLAEWLRQNNQVDYRGSSEPFSEANIATAIDALREETGDVLSVTNERLTDLVILGKGLKQTVQGAAKSFQLRYIDWDTADLSGQADRNVYHVTEEYRVARPGRDDHFVPDLVLFVNGIPLGVIECKKGDPRPGGDPAVKQGITQQIRNQKPDGIPKLYRTAQVLGAVSPAGLIEGSDDDRKAPARYGTVGTPEVFWAAWREDDGRDKRIPGAEIERIVNTPLPAAVRDKLLANCPAAVRNDFERAEREGRLVTEQDRMLVGVFSRHRLLSLIRRYMLFDQGTKKVARYQQFFCVEKIRERIRRRDADGSRRGGVVWHTQGSGKSLTMVMLAKAIALDRRLGLLPEARAEKILLVTDRIDLDDQIYKTFIHCGMQPEQAGSGADLASLLSDPESRVIATTIGKFEAAVNKHGTRIENADIYVLVDEGHRTQFGISHANMRRAIPNACYIGFTGTPIAKKHRSTVERFGGLIDAYTLQDAEHDEVVVPLVYEGRHVTKDVDQKEIDDWFDQYTEGLTQDQKDALKKRFSSADSLMQAEPVIRRIARDVSEHFRGFLKNTGLRAQLVAPSKSAAILYRQALEEIGRGQPDAVRSEVLISAPDDREGDEDPYGENSDIVNRFWKNVLERFGNEKHYNDSLIGAFKNGDTRDPHSSDPEILIVVHKLLTGFDAPPNTVLYLGRRVKEHNLLQAIARVNRLYPGKERGYIMDYRGVLEDLDEAFQMYARDEDDPDADVLGFVSPLKNVSEIWSELPQCRSALLDLFKPLGDTRDFEEYAQFLTGTDEESELRRVDFYERFSAFARVLDVALASAGFHEQTPPKKIAKYREELKFFTELRRQVRLRSAETIPYSEYEPKIRALLDRHVRTSGIEEITGKIDLQDREQVAAALEAVGSASSKAELIAANVQRVLDERVQHEDPESYRRFSAMLRDTIEKMRQEWLSAADALVQVDQVRAEVLQPTSQDVPAALQGHRFAEVLFRNLRDRLDGAAESAAARLGQQLGDLAIVNWRQNEDQQKRMRQVIDDTLLELGEEHALGLTFEQIDGLVDEIMDRARALL